MMACCVLVLRKIYFYGLIGLLPVIQNACGSVSDPHSHSPELPPICIVKILFCRSAFDYALETQQTRTTFHKCLQKLFYDCSSSSEGMEMIKKLKYKTRVFGVLRVSYGESAAVEPWHCLETINKCLRESDFKKQIDCLRRFTCADDVDESMRQKYINETIKEKSESEWKRNIDAGDIAHAYMKADGSTSNGPRFASSFGISGWSLVQILMHGLLFP